MVVKEPIVRSIDQPPLTAKQVRAYFEIPPERPLDIVIDGPDGIDPVTIRSI